MKIAFRKLKSITPKKVDNVYDFGVRSSHRIIARKKGSINAFYTSNCSHPDAEEFIRAKQTSGVLTKFNMSVVLDDEFMRAVESDSFFEQKFNGKVFKKVKARDLYDLVMQSTYNRSEPGVLFSDNMMKNNPIAYLGELKCVNPCVSPETLILTDKGEFEIGPLEGKKVNVWNGVEYSEVLIEKTGLNKNLYRVSFSNGKFLDCTEYHKFSIDLHHETYKISAKDLKVGYEITPFNLSNGEITSGVSIASIEDLGRVSDVYCFNESKRHMGMFNGILTCQCGEIPGLSSITTVCLLGSPNLTQYVKIGTNEQPYFDFDEYTEDIKTFMRMLDNVNDLTYSPLPSYQWVIENLRQVGMGVNGLGSTIMMLKMSYDSPEAIEFTKKISMIKENMTWQTSALLAKEKGAFSAYNEELFESTEYFKSDRIDDTTKDLIRKYGVRNAKTTTCPPLGNCVVGSTKIITSDGIKSLKNIFNENGLTDRDGANRWYIPLKETLVKTLTGFSRVTGLFLNGKKNILSVVTKKCIIKGTEDHKVLVKVSDTSAKWKKIGDLKIGDRILRQDLL